MSNEIKTQSKAPLAKFADQYELDPAEMKNTLINTVFRQKGDQQVTDAQMVALLIVANQYELNPFTKEIYAFPDKQNGVVPIVGVDGWTAMANRHKEFRGFEYRYSETMVKMDEDAKPCPEWMECVVYRKDRDMPVVVREYLDEVYRPAFKKQGYQGNPGYTVAGPWQTHTKRMLRHKVMIQALRTAFSFSGVYDEDEAYRIVEQQEKEINPQANRPNPNEAPVSQSRSEELAEKLKARQKPKQEQSEPAKEPEVKEEEVIEAEFEEVEQQQAETQQEAEQVKDKKDEKTVLEFLNKIRAAQTMQDLAEIAANIPTTLTEDERDEVRGAWAVRRDEIQG